MLCFTHGLFVYECIHLQLSVNAWLFPQWGNGTFNRAKLLNVGVREALRDEDWSCIFLHDVDLLPENDHNTYTCHKQFPTHLSVAMDKFRYRYSTGVCMCGYAQAYKGILGCFRDQENLISHNKKYLFAHFSFWSHYGGKREHDSGTTTISCLQRLISLNPLSFSSFTVLS